MGGGGCAVLWIDAHYSRLMRIQSFQQDCRRVMTYYLYIYHNLKIYLCYFATHTHTYTS
jgi:hypothetical protein